MPNPRFWRAVGLLAAGSLLTGCEFSGDRSIFEPVGSIAQQQLDLFMWTYWLSWGVMILVAAVLLIAIVRFRRRGDESIPAQTHGNVPLEIAWTILPVIIVILVAVPTVRTIFATENRVEASADDLIVNVTGYQWWWRFEYPEYGITTANELHIPQDRRVILNLASADVLHSFWAPKFAGKRDLIPNQDNQLWFVADGGDGEGGEVTPPGVYSGHCAELCLGAHAYMRFRVVVSDEAGFDGWVASFQDLEPQLAQSEDPEITRGRELFAQKGCTNCHTIDNYRANVMVGDPDFPNLTNFGLRNTVAAGVLDNTPENLAAWLRDPQTVKPGNYMPTLWPLPDETTDAQEAQVQAEVEAITAYLLSLGVDGAAQAQSAPDDALPTLALAPLSAGGTHGDR